MWGPETITVESRVQGGRDPTNDEGRQLVETQWYNSVEEKHKSGTVVQLLIKKYEGEKKNFMDYTEDWRTYLWLRKKKKKKDFASERESGSDLTSPH